MKKAKEGSYRGKEAGSAWLERQSGSTIPGKVNYRQLFKTVNLFDTSKPDDYDDMKRVARNLRYNDEHKSTLKSPMEMKQDFLKNGSSIFNDPVDADQPEHFYSKNFFEYPLYEYVGGEDPDPAKINY